MTSHDLTVLISNMTPTTLAQMYMDTKGSETAGAILQQMIAICGEDETAELLSAVVASRPAPAPAPNDAALATFMGHIATAQGHLVRIQEYLDDHAGVLPEEVHWGHVGDVAHVADTLRDVARFINNYEDEEE